MKILLSTDSIRYPLTGIGRYTYELALALRRTGRLEELLFWDGNRAVVCSEFPFKGAVLSEPYAKERQFFVRNVKKIPFAADIYRTFRSRRAANQMRRLNEYSGFIYHNTNYQLFDFPGNNVVTFFDLSVFHFPEYHPADRVRAVQKSMMDACRLADVIVTTSEFSKKCIVEHFAFPEERVFVTSLAAAREFKPMNREETAHVLSDRGLHFKRYSLFVGTVEPRKNLDFLLDVYESLPCALRMEFPLVVCGDEGWKSEYTRVRLRTAEAQGWVRYFNFLPQKELPFLMAGATVFLFPSLYEGFGLPPLEAMQSGVPVVASNRTSLPEVVGDAGVLLELEDRDAWCEAILRCLENQEGQEENVRRGLARAALFSWERCANGTIAAYETVSGC